MRSDSITTQLSNVGPDPVRLFVCLFVIIKPTFLYFASRLGLEVNPQGVYTLGPRISSYGPTKGTPPPRTTLRATCD